jgi:UDP-glucose 4-epimerase
MTVLVTGGAGYIGSHMLLALQEANESLVVLDNLSTGSLSAIPHGIRMFEGNVGNEHLVRSILAAHQVDTVIHFAASIVVPESVRYPLTYYLNNTVCSRSLIAAAVDAGVSNFILSSTAAVYGNPEVVPVDETAPTVPLSPYGRSKIMAEMMLRDAADAHGLRYIILRYFNVAGADPKLRTGQSTPDASHLIKLALQTALGERSELQVFGTDYPTSDGTCIRDFIHVADLVQAHLAALAYLRNDGASITLNCGYGIGSSVLEVIKAVELATGGHLPVAYVGRRLGDPVSVIAKADRIRKLLNWTPQFEDLNTIVAHALAWEKKLRSSQADPLG